MKKTFWLPVGAIVIGALGLMILHSPTRDLGRMYPGYMAQQQGGQGYCPYCGENIKPGRGYGMGPGMMGRGYGPGQGMMGPGYGYGSQYQQTRKPLDEKAAKGLLENYLKASGNSNLKLGRIEDKDQVFEAEIVTKEDSLVDKLVLDKRTGWIQSVY